MQGKTDYGIDFVSAVNRSIHNFFKYVLCILNFSVACSINFNYIQRNRICNINTIFTLPARINRRTFLTVKGFCKNTCSRCFTGAARTCKKICMRNSIHSNSISKSFFNMFLTDYFFQFLRTVFSV